MTDWVITLRNWMDAEQPAVPRGEIAWRARGPPARGPVSRATYKGDAISLDLTAVCSGCGRPHFLRLSHPDTFHSSQAGRLDRNLCNTCSFSIAPGRVPARGPRRAEIEVMVRFMHQPNGEGSVVMRACRRELAPCRQNAWQNRVQTYSWSSVGAKPRLQFNFQCNSCGSVQCVASTNRLEGRGTLPEQWTCKKCHAQHMRSWIHQSAVVTHRLLRCHFCCAEPLRNVVLRQNDQRFSSDGAFQCQNCSCVGAWAAHWKKLQMTCTDVRVLMPSETLWIVLDMLSGLCRLSIVRNEVSHARLVYLRRVPMGALPLPLSRDVRDMAI